MIEGARAMVRPGLIFLLGMGALFIVLEGIESPNADWWVRIFFAVIVEWVIERPALKLMKGEK